MIYKAIVMCRATEEDRPTYYRFKAEGVDPDEALRQINKFINKIQRSIYMNLVNDKKLQRESIYLTMKEIKKAFYVVEMHQSNGDFSEGQCDIKDCRLLRKSKNA